MKNEFKNIPIFSILWRATLYFPLAVLFVFLWITSFVGPFLLVFTGLVYLWCGDIINGLIYCAGAPPLWFIYLFIKKRYWEEPTSFL